MNNIENLIKASVLIFDVPFMINLPNGDYNVYIDNTYATVKLERFRSPTDMPGLPKGVIFPSNSYILGDRWGRFNHTKIQVTFHHHIYIKATALLPSFLFSKAIDIINRLLSVCRGVKGDHYIRLITSDVFSYNVFYFGSDGKQVNESVFASMPDSIMAMGGTSEATNEQVTKIREILSTNAQLPLFQEIILDAWDYHFYRNYRAAVIESGTAFEIFIDNFIWERYSRLGKTEEEIKNILETGLKNLLREHIRKVTGTNFSATQQYLDWEKYAYEIRNETIHRGTRVSDADSVKAIETVTDTIKFLMSL